MTEVEKLKAFGEFVAEINASNSRNHKIAVLEKYKSHEHIEFIKFILDYVFNTYKITGISEKKMYGAYSSVEHSQDFDTVEEFLTWILINKTGSNYVLSVVNDYILYFSDGELDLIETLQRAIMKDMPLGISETTINKVFPGLIPTFDLMLAEKYKDNKDRLVGKEITITRKLDGNRCLLFHDTYGDSTMLTRQGRLYEGLVEIEAEAKDHLPRGYVYDGELIADADHLSTEEKYRLTTGTLHKKGNKKKDLIFHVFDMVPIHEFEKQQSSEPYSVRKNRLSKVTKNIPHIVEVKTLYQGVYDPETVDTIVQAETEAGEEGVMININDATYQFKRTRDLLKVKLFNNADVRIIGYYEGTGEFVGTLGGVTVEFIDPTGQLSTANVGSGFKLDVRQLLWNDKESLIGRIIEITYFEISQNKDGDYSLRFPIYQRMRDDKSEISMY